MYGEIIDDKNVGMVGHFIAIFGLDYSHCQSPIEIIFELAYRFSGSQIYNNPFECAYKVLNYLEQVYRHGEK